MTEMIAVDTTLIILLALGLGWAIGTRLAVWQFDRRYQYRTNSKGGQKSEPVPVDSLVDSQPKHEI